MPTHDLDDYAKHAHFETRRPAFRAKVDPGVFRRGERGGISMEDCSTLLGEAEFGGLSFPAKFYFRENTSFRMAELDADLRGKWFDDEIFHDMYGKVATAVRKIAGEPTRYTPRRTDYEFHFELYRVPIYVGGVLDGHEAAVQIKLGFEAPPTPPPSPSFDYLFDE